MSERTYTLDLPPSEAVMLFGGAAAEAGWLAARYRSDAEINLVTHNATLGDRNCLVDMAVSGREGSMAHFVLIAPNPAGPCLVTGSFSRDDVVPEVSVPPLEDDSSELSGVRMLMHTVAATGERLPKKQEQPTLAVVPFDAAGVPFEELTMESRVLIPLLGQVVQVLGRGAVMAVRSGQIAQSQLKVKFDSAGTMHRFPIWNRHGQGRGRLFFEGAHKDNGTRTSFEMVFGPTSTPEGEPQRSSLTCKVSATYRGRPRETYTDTIKQLGSQVRAVRTAGPLNHAEYRGSAPATAQTILHMADLATVASALPPEVDGWET